MHICHLTLGHTPYDDRIYYKECWGIRHWADRVTVIGKETEIPETTYPEIEVLTFPWGNLLQRFGKAFDLAVDLQADIYHLHEPELLPMIPLLRNRTSAAFVYDMHEPLAEVILDFSRNPWYQRYATALAMGGYERLLLSLPNSVIFTSKILSSEFQKYTRHSTILYNFPRLDLFESAPGEERGTQYTVLYQGQIAPSRGIVDLVKGFYLYYREHQQGRLRLVGSVSSPEFRRTLLGAFSYFNLTHAAALEQAVPHTSMRPILQSASVGIMALHPTPAFRKSVQIKTFEYMATGLPVIAGNYASAHQFVASRNAGIVLEETTPRTIAGALGDLYTHPEKRRQMGQRGQQAVHEQWNWSAMNRKLQHLYLGIARPMPEID